LFIWKGKLMKVSIGLAAWGLTLLIISIDESHARAQTEQDKQASCRAVVRSFYRWYVPLALKDQPLPAWEIAVKDRGRAFNSELLEGLKEESRIQIELQDAGLDFDPFLNSQDPSDRYIVGNTRLEGEDRCWAKVYGAPSGRKNQKAAVKAELVLKNGHWLFANFHYQKSDLLRLLQSLRRRLGDQTK
jgi:hypothetical protein